MSYRTLGVLLGAGIAAATLCGAPAFAADMPVKAEPLFNWTGWYICGNGGYSWGRVKEHFTSTTSSYDVTTKVHGGEASADGGYCWQTKSTDYVYCLDVRYDFPHERGSTTTPALVPTNTTNQIGTFLIGPRAGFLTDRNLTLWYATGGLTLDDAKNVTSIPGDTATGTKTAWRAGFFVGAGVERMLDRHWSVKVEYDFEYYGSGGFSNTLSPCAGTTRCVAGTTPVVNVGKAYDNIIAATIAYHFNSY